MDTSSGNVLKTIVYGISKRKLTKNIGQKLNSWKKAKPTGPKKTSGRILDP